VTVNLFSLHAMESVVGIPLLEQDFLAGKIFKQLFQQKQNRLLTSSVRLVCLQAKANSVIIGPISKKSRRTRNGQKSVN
jgi:hypothetical protein